QVGPGAEGIGDQPFEASGTVAKVAVFVQVEIAGVADFQRHGSSFDLVARVWEGAPSSSSRRERSPLPRLSNDDRPHSLFSTLSPLPAGRRDGEREYALLRASNCESTSE